MTWTYVMEETELPEGGMAPVYPLGVAVVVARVGGALFAVSGKCAHMTCPCHDWRFDIRTGRFIDAPELGLAVYGVKAEAGKLFVALA